MSVAGHSIPGQGSAKGDDPLNEGSNPGVRMIIDLPSLDLGKRMYTRDDIAKYNPHRGNMALIDSIVWETPDHKQGVAVKHVRDDEFWVQGHFPDKAMMPGVMMIEAGAQLACFLYNIRRPDPKIVAFLRIETASFRSMVVPGDDLYLLCCEVKFGRRHFISDIQGVVGDRIAFDARITGMSLPAVPGRPG
jgi:3-hydroxyacyl-[acyl-carrier-protein] dehydratase